MRQPGGGFAPLSEGRLWVNVNGPHDYHSEHLPLDIFKNARKWISYLDGGGYNSGAALLETVLDENGYPTQIPPTMTLFETILLSQQRIENASVLNGRYRFTYDGTGTYQIIGPGVSNVVYSAGQAEFDYAVPASPVDGTIAVQVTATTNGNHLRNMRMYKVSDAALVASGRITRPNYPFNNVGNIRWMECQLTNNAAGTRDTNDWPKAGGYSWDWRGIPPEDICTISNELGISPWICLPHQATDAYVTHIATVMRNNLNPALKCYVEFSNEIWNFGFTQASYAVAQATALWGTDPGNEGRWLQWHGGRGAQVMDIFTSVFAGQTHRLVRVLGTATGNPGFEAFQLDAPLWVGLGRPAPHLSYDAIAVTGYWGSALNWDAAVAPLLLDQLNISQAAAEAFMRDRYMPSSSADTALPELFGEWDYFRGVCNTRNKQLLMYEGGTHFLLPDAYQNHPTLQPFIDAYNYSTDIVEFYRVAAAKWDTIGDGGFNQFVTYGFPNRFGSWGMLRYWGDSTPRSQFLLNYNNPALSGAPTVGAKTRDTYAFLNSLHNHDAGAGNENTSTGNWVRRLAVAAPTADRTYTLGWQFGFAAPSGGWTTLPRSSQQEVVPNVYINDPGNPAWTGATNIEVVELVPDNFFGPLVAPDQTNSEGWVYTTRFLHYIDAWETNAPNPNRVYAIHGGWPDMAAYGDPATISASQVAAYQAHALGTYQNWLDSLTSMLQAARPSLNIVQYGINRASIRTWRNTVVNSIATGTLFEDDAPHGRSTMYFLNSVANYIELFNEKPPAGFTFDSGWGVNSAVTNNYRFLVNYIWSVLRH